MKCPPIDLSEANLEYLKGLKVGDKVVEMGQSCMYGKEGVVYESKQGFGLCVKWFLENGSCMGTSVTHGTRRLSDLQDDEAERIIDEILAEERAKKA